MGTVSLLALLFACLLSGGGDPDSVFNKIHNQSHRVEFGDAKREAAHAFAPWRSRPETLWHWKFKLQYAELLLQDGDTEKARSLLTKAPPDRFNSLIPRFEMLNAYVAYRDQKGGQAQSLLTKAVAAAHAASDFELEADCELVGATYHPTDHQIEQILEIAREHGLHFQISAAYLAFGLLRIDESRFGEAIVYFKKAAATAEQADATLIYSLAMGDMATCYYNLGDFDTALDLRNKAMRIQERAGLKTALRDSYGELATSEVLQRQSPQAIENFRHALSIVDARDSSERYSSITGDLASALITTGALEEAQRLNQQARAMAETSDTETQATLALNDADIAKHRGQKEIAIRQYQKAISFSRKNPSTLWTSYAALGSMYAGIGQANEAKSNFENALRTIEASRAEQHESAYKIGFLSQLIRLYQDYVEILVGEGDDARALEIADSSRAGVLTQDVLGVKTGLDRGLVPRVQQMSRQSGTTFLFYWLAPKHSYLWVVNGEVFQKISLRSGEEIAQEVRSYRNFLQQEKIDPLAVSNPLSSRMFDELVKPALQWIPKEARVTIVPDDALHSLNFESLVVRGAQPHYWLQDATISIAPSLGILTMEDAAASRRKPRLLLIGDPNLKGTGFAELPDAKSEMNRVRNYFPREETKVRNGPDAVPSSYRDSQPARFTNIHFATHAEANEKSPLDSAIILSKESDNDSYRLYAHEIMDVRLTADLVTISACRGAGARTLSGEGLVGFAWAFFQAGARNVVAGLWEVNDRSTSDLMNSFYERMNEGESYAEALRGAKLAILHTSFKRPYFWAPFQLYSRTVNKFPGKQIQTTNPTKKEMFQ